MTFLEALEAVAADLTLMAMSVHQKDLDGIIYVPQEHPCWRWNSGARGGIPNLKLVKGEWEVVKKTLDSRLGHPVR